MSTTPLLSLHKVVPLFTLPDKHGQTHNLAKQRGRDHYLMVMFRGDGVPPAQYMRDLATQAEAWRQLPARGLVVVSSADAAGALGSLPFTLLIDDTSRVIDRFLPQDAKAGVFTLDRYGDLYQQWVVADLSELPSGTEIDGWLQAISMQCSI